MSHKISKVWNLLVIACVVLVVLLAIAQAPVLVMGPARAIVWVAKGVSSLLIGSAHAQDIVQLETLTVHPKAPRGVIYSCTPFTDTSSAQLCTLLAPGHWQDKAVMSPDRHGRLVGYSMDECAIRKVVIDPVEGLFSSTVIRQLNGCTGQVSITLNAWDIDSQW